MRLLVVIINYKTPVLVCEAVASLEQELDFEVDHVVVIDNHSADGSLDAIQAFIDNRNWSHWVSLVDSGHNGGFSFGNNIGLKFEDADYYLLLNSDAYVRKNAIQSLLKVAQSGRQIGFVGPSLEWSNGAKQTSSFYNRTPLNEFLHAAQTGIFTKLLGYFNVHEVAIPLDFHGQNSPEWLSFACILLNGKMVKEIGLMDDGFFMYYEDIDYCRRAQLAKWTLAFDANASVVHLNLGDSNHAEVRRLPDYYFKSRYRYFVKYYGRLGLLMANTLWSFGRCFSLLREWLERKPTAFHNTMWRDIWIGFLK